jgi:hypothetical protein
VTLRPRINLVSYLEDLVKFINIHVDIVKLYIFIILNKEKGEIKCKVIMVYNLVSTIK